MLSEETDYRCLMGSLRQLEQLKTAYIELEERFVGANETIVTLTSEHDELKADLVWAVENAVFQSSSPGVCLVTGFLLDWQFNHDGTPDGLCASARVARKGEK